MSGGAANAAARPQAPAGLLGTLLAFEQAPGRYAVVLREPRQLFDHMQAVMLLAAGRDLPELAEPLKQQPQARQAARFFVRTVMLRPGADHYTLLGLTPGFEPGTLREHYRLMIRLTHPDFAGDEGEWPADAATRINLANDVLASSVRRAEYNASLAGAGQAGPAAGGGAHPAHGARQPQTGAGRPLPAAAVVRARPGRSARSAGAWPEAWTLRLKVALASLGALGAGWALLAMNPPGSDSSLVVQAAKKQATDVAVEAAPPLLATPSVKVAVEAPAAQPAEAPRASPVEAQALRAEVKQENPAQVARVRPVRHETAAAEIKAEAAAPLPVPAPVVKVAAAPAPAVVAPAPAVWPAPAEVKAPPTPIASPAPQTITTTAAAQPAKPAVAAADAIPSLEQVKPLLAKIVQRSRGGLGVPVATLIHPTARVSPASQAFVFAFQDELAGMKVLDVVRTDMSSRESQGGLVVDMKMTFQVEDTNGWAATRQMNLRAHFSQVEHAPALTRLVVNP